MINHDINSSGNHWNLPDNSDDTLDSFGIPSHSCHYFHVVEDKLEQKSQCRKLSLDNPHTSVNRNIGICRIPLHHVMGWLI